MKLNLNKCGEMFRTDDGSNCFQCGQCGIDFGTSHQFVDHIEQHFPILTSCLPTTKTELCFDETVLIKEEPICSIDFTNDFVLPENLPHTEEIKCEPYFDEITDAKEFLPILESAEANGADVKVAKVDNFEIENDDNYTELTNEVIDEIKTSIAIPSRALKRRIQKTDSYNKQSKSRKTVKNNGKSTEDEPTHFTCEYCFKSFTIKCKEKHMWTHNNEYPYKCEFCDKGYMSRSILDKHRVVHRANYTMPTCDYCGKMFPSKFKITQHILRKHVEGYVIPVRFRCEDCDRGFTTRGPYDAHLRRHRNEKPYQCVTCGLAYVSAKSLNKHSRRHLEKKYICDICNRKFLKEHEMYQHKLTHSGLKPFECEVCHKNYASMKVLGQHRRLHDPEKRYKCKICEKRFHQSSGRRKHEKDVHNLIYTPPSVVLVRNNGPSIH